MSGDSFRGPMIIRVLLCAPVAELCDGHLRHVVAAANALGDGGLTLAKWFARLTPHGMHDAYVSIEWQCDDDSSLWVRYRIAVDGAISIDAASRDEPLYELMPECFDDGRKIAAVGAVVQTSVGYGIGDAFAWACSLASGHDRELPTRTGGGEGLDITVGPSGIDLGEMLRLLGAKLRPEEN